jgi:hypothetical protein
VERPPARGRPRLDPSFTRRLETDSRTLWARHIDDEQLAGLIWVLGDFSGRCRVLTEQLDEYRSEIDPDATEYPRARALLQRLSDLVNAARSSAPAWPPRPGETDPPAAAADRCTKIIDVGRYAEFPKTWRLDLFRCRPDCGEKILSRRRTFGVSSYCLHLESSFGLT